MKFRSYFNLNRLELSLFPRYFNTDSAKKGSYNEFEDIYNYQNIQIFGNIPQDDNYE